MGGHPERAPSHPELGPVDSGFGTQGHRRAVSPDHVGRRPDRLGASGRLETDIAGKGPVGAHAEAGDGDDDVRVVLGVEEVSRAQVLVALVVLGGERGGVEADGTADGAIGSNGAFALDPLEVAVDGDRAPELFGLELGARIRPGRGPTCPGSLAAIPVGQRRSLARRAGSGSWVASCQLAIGLSSCEVLLRARLSYRFRTWASSEAQC